ARRRGVVSRHAARAVGRHRQQGHSPAVDRRPRVAARHRRQSLMTTRRSVSSISISLLLLAVPTAALAGPPETEQPADTPGLLSDGLLSDAETQRLARVEAFEVVVNPIANHSTGKNLALACSQLPEELVDVPHVERRAEDASLQAELAGGDQAKLARAIDGLRSLKLPADRSKLLAQA